MPQFFFRCYPWDLEEEGIEAALDRMAELGVDAASIVTVHHRVSELRPRATFGRRVTEMEAGAHFIPTRKCYVNTRIRPTSAGWMKSRNPLEKIVRQAERRGVKLRASLSCCRSDAMVAKYPDAACVNVFGAPSAERLCPAIPDVREYAGALVEDLSTNYPFETLEVSHADFGNGEDFQRYLTRGVTPGAADRALWSWCFCAACRQRAADAGLDVEATAEKVREHLERMLRLEPPTHATFESWPVAEASLAAYQRMRVEAVTSLAKSIRSRTKARLVLDLNLPSWTCGVNMEHLREQADGFMLAFPGGEALSAESRYAEETNLRMSFDDSVRAAGGAGRVDVSVLCCPPGARDGPSLVATVHRARQAGHASIGFFNYGLAPEPCLDWVRQAVRFAKREDAV